LKTWGSVSHHDYEPFTANVLRIDRNSLIYDSKTQQLLLYHSYLSVGVKRHSVYLKVIKMVHRWLENWTEMLLKTWSVIIKA